MIPDHITKESVLAALAIIDRDGVDDPKALAKVHNLRYNERSYPPKYTIAIANQVITDKRLDSRTYTTTEAQAYLKKLGPEFTIISHSLAPQQELIDRYKLHLADNQLKDESYKWQLVNTFQGRPNLEAEDFGAEITAIDYSNLIFHDAIAVRNHLGKARPEDYRAAFRILFDESLPLQDRIDRFQTMVNATYHDLEPTLSHRHDERTIATFLAYYKPDHYSFYKNSFYKKYCRKLQTKAAAAGHKYPHYLGMIEGFINDYLRKDDELLEMVAGYLPENAYPDDAHTILAQDILYRMLDKRYETFTAIVDDLAESLTEDDELIGRFHPGRREDHGLEGKGESYAWIVADGDILNSLDAHFEVSIRKAKKPMVFVDIHFEGKQKKKFKKLIGDLPLKCEWFTWQSAESIRFKGGIDIADEELIEKIKEQLRYLESQLGDKIRALVKNDKNNQQITLPLMPAAELNQILFGPPGTGKTYNTIDRALKIIDEQRERELDWNNRDAVTRLFRDRIEEGRIVFTTFHQSLAYEDFIEGLKPETTDDNKVIYHVRDGLFKALCIQAERPRVKTDNFDTTYQQLLDEIDAAPEKKIVLETLVHAKEFTIYKNSKNNIRFHANTEKAYDAVIRKDYLKEYLLTGQTLDWASYTKAVGEYMKANFSYNQQTDYIPQNYVLIIDEINRGNVSQIFGELITLIESDKRTGAKEALTVTLPYSQQKFGVPPNVFIVGTMNTADRSVEALDTALRRRFVFHEMPPKPHLLQGKENTDAALAGLDLALLLKTINDRITVLLDRDHLIGHSFFINVETISDLKIAIHQKVIPLLQEYFYGDYGKIGLVMGEGFVQLVKNDAQKVFAPFRHYDASAFETKEQYELVDYTLHDQQELIINDNATAVTFRQALDYLLSSN